MCPPGLVIVVRLGLCHCHLVTQRGKTTGLSGLNANTTTEKVLTCTLSSAPCNPLT